MYIFGIKNTLTTKRVTVSRRRRSSKVESCVETKTKETSSKKSA